MQKAVRYRLYPTERQKELLSKHFGSVRFIYNLALETKSWVYSAYKISLSRYELKEQVRELKQDCPWLREVNSQSLQAALRDLDRAYINFFKGRAGFPVYKKRKNRQSFHCPQYVSIEADRLRIPKFREGIEVRVVYRRGG